MLWLTLSRQLIWDCVLGTLAQCLQSPTSCTENPSVLDSGRREVLLLLLGYTYLEYLTTVSVNDLQLVLKSNCFEEVKVQQKSATAHTDTVIGTDMPRKPWQLRPPILRLNSSPPLHVNILPRLSLPTVAVRQGTILLFMVKNMSIREHSWLTHRGSYTVHCTQFLLSILADNGHYSAVQ